MNEENLAIIEALCEDIARLARAMGMLHQESTELRNRMAFALGTAEHEEKKAA